MTFSTANAGYPLQDAWGRGQQIAVHGWVYGLNDGLLKNLDCTMSGPDSVVQNYAAALKRYPRAAAADGAQS